MTTYQNCQQLEENIKEVINMRNILVNMTIPSVKEIELSQEWQKLLLITKQNYLQTKIFELNNDKDINCNKCHKMALYKTSNEYLCWEHSI